MSEQKLFTTQAQWMLYVSTFTGRRVSLCADFGHGTKTMTGVIVTSNSTPFFYFGSSTNSTMYVLHIEDIYGIEEAKEITADAFWNDIQGGDTHGY